MTTPIESTAEHERALGEARYRAGAYGEAAAIFARRVAQAPGDAAALRLLGLCRLRLGDPAGALRHLTRARELAPEDPYVQLHYGLALHEAGRHAEAAAVFRKCQSLLPDDPAPFLNLAAALLALGDAMAAADAARRARRRAPKMPHTHYMLGLARLNAGQLDGAEEAFRAAVRLAPDFADAWVNLGLVHYRRSNMNGAKAAMRRALEAAPGHRAATGNLGAFMRLTGESEAAEALLREALARDPGNTEARLNIAADLLQEARPAEGLALLDAVPAPADPRQSGHWHLQRALALLQLGRAAEAKDILAALGEGSAELRPLLLWRRVLLAAAEGDRAAARSIAEQMESALREPGPLVPEHRIMAWYDLARFWSREDEPARAFTGWREGHALLGRMQPFSRPDWRAFVDANFAAFDRARFAQGPRAANRDPAPVFIVGMPRSGTTLAEQILGAHPAAFGAGERSALSNAFTRLGGGWETARAVERIAALDQAALDEAAQGYLAELHALAPDKARIVDKMPGNFAFLGLVGLILPGARIIQCTRDPRDIGLSIFTFRFYGHHPYAHDLADIGWYIGEHERLMAHWHAALPNPILTLALKDWVEDFDGTLRRVLDFLDLPYDPACERFYEAPSRVRTVSRDQVRQPVNARGLGRWRAYQEELQALIAELRAAGVLRDD
ncbi:MAG: sulfotransferase [Alphaproteobacteria bacterium]|nr:sulfotransferase [Alphaproteobacteria bacterium]